MKLTRKEKEKIAKRDNILMAAEEVFGEKGFAAATLDEIAEKAEFSKAALYLYFKSKQDLFLNLIKERFGEMEQKIADLIQLPINPIKKIEHYALLHREFNFNHIAFFKIMARLKAEFGSAESKLTVEIKNQLTELFQNYIEILSSVINEAIVDGYIKSNDKYLITHLLMGILNAVLHRVTICIGDKKEIDLEKEYNQALDIFLNGILI